LLLAIVASSTLDARYYSGTVSGARSLVRAAQATLVVALALTAKAARADTPPAEPLERAAATFDAGVKAFESAEFELAARQFLRADELVPNPDALYNAIMAAERAKHDALLATAAERAASRQGSGRELAARAEKTLAEVRARVARFVLSCAPTPCELAIDGEHAAAGASYALPGARLVTARFADGSLAERRVDAMAAGERSITLELESRGSPRVAAATVVPQSDPNAAAFGEPAGAADRARPLSPTLFYVGAGVTLALAGATTWSGIDTLRAKDRLPGTESDNDAVLSRAHRTDALLIGTVLAGAATATIGLVWTDWAGSDSQLSLHGAFGERAALVTLRATH
jgi:hypothetical protein